MPRDSVFFTSLKSLDYNVVMTFRFNNNNNNNNVFATSGEHRMLVQHGNTADDHQLSVIEF